MDTRVALGTVTPRDPSTPPAALGVWGEAASLFHSQAGFGHLELLRCQLSHQLSVCPSPQLSFTLSLRQKPLIKPLARGQGDNTARKCSAGRKGLQGPPFPTQDPTLSMDECQAGSASPQHHPWHCPSITPGPQGTAHPPLPSPGTVHAASRQTDKVHFTFPGSAGENFNKDKV